MSNAFGFPTFKIKLTAKSTLFLLSCTSFNYKAHMHGSTNTANLCFLRTQRKPTETWEEHTQTLLTENNPNSWNCHATFHRSYFYWILNTLQCNTAYTITFVKQLKSMNEKNISEWKLNRWLSFLESHAAVYSKSHSKHVKKFLPTEVWFWDVC